MTDSHLNSFHVLIIIPTYNERESLPKLLEQIGVFRAQNSTPEISVLIVDDNSPDKTASVVKNLNLSFVSVLDRPVKLGLGPAYVAGFQWGLAREFSHFMEMDADGSHLVSDLPHFLASITDCDLAIGTRWIPGGMVINWPRTRRWISKAGTWYAAQALALPYRDLTSGYRLFSRQLLDMLPLSEISTKGYGFQVEMALRSRDCGAVIKEIPITFVEREFGKSKMSGSIMIEAATFVTKKAFERRILRH